MAVSRNPLAKGVNMVAWVCARVVDCTRIALLTLFSKAGGWRVALLAVGLPWVCRGFAVGLPWLCRGFAVAFVNASGWLT